MKLCGVAQKWRDHREAAKKRKLLLNLYSFYFYLYTALDKTGIKFIIF